MDNLTHTLVGLAAAETWIQSSSRRRASTRELRPTLWLVSAIANNLPDLDFVYCGITPGALGRLLHHRGHTHTLALAPLAALVSIAMSMALYSILSKKTGATTRRMFFSADALGLALLGAPLHVALDWLNFYGVHPFWPFSNKWVYGDTVFILEPFFWLLLIPALAPLAPAVWIRRTLWGALLALLTAMVLTGFVPPLLVATFAATAAWLWGWAQKPFLSHLRFPMLLGTTIATTLAFLALSRGAHWAVRQTLAETNPSETVHDIVLGAYPFNPLCWTTLAVATAPDGSYLVRRGVASLAPRLWGAAHCPELWGSQDKIAFAQTPTAPSRPWLLWREEFRAPLSELRRLRTDSCAFRAFLQFARAPVWWRADGRAWASDFRFQRSTSSNFSRVAIDGAQCPSALPNWTEPIAGIL